MNGYMKRIHFDSREDENKLRHTESHTFTSTYMGMLVSCAERQSVAETT